MAELSSTGVTWTERMELLRDSAQQRVLTAPMPTAAMEQLLADGKAHALGNFEDSPVHYMERWWRASEPGWMALDEASSAQLNLHAERYRAATAATSSQRTADAPSEGDAEPPAARTEEGAA